MGVQHEMFLSLQELVLEEHRKQEQGDSSSLQVPLNEEKGEIEQEENSKHVEDIQEIIGYEFRDPTVLQKAFTHHSCKEGCSSLDRLAYVGDAFLNFMIAKELYSLYPDLDPGKLTRLRAANVDTEKLARVALKYELHKFLRHNIPLLAVQIEEFRDAITEYPLHSSGLIDAPKVLADIVESLVGAIFVDSNCSMETTWEVAENMLEPIITPATLPIHPVTQLQEICQKKKLTVEIRDMWRETGEIEFIVDGQYSGRAKYGAKRVVAKNRAALDAYNQIVEKVVAGCGARDFETAV